MSGRNRQEGREEVWGDERKHLRGELGLGKYRKGKMQSMGHGIEVTILGRSEDTRQTF